MTESPSFVLLLSCKNVPGIVSKVSTYLFELGFNIRASHQFDDEDSGHFFMRVEFRYHDQSSGREPTLSALKEGFTGIARRFDMEWKMEDTSHRARVLIMVSKFGHCLNDLLFRTRTGALRIEIPAIVSNHRDFEGLADNYGIPFHHIPVTAGTKASAERQLLEIISDERIELTVLARYMQVLSPELCRDLEGRAVNIHHSMLPSFKGAKPYHQAFDRGVKMVGATAHYVTSNLDEGPIIEQDIARVDHTLDTADITAAGRDLECRALARAVRWDTENRILLNGHRTVVFR